MNISLDEKHGFRVARIDEQFLTDEDIDTAIDIVKSVFRSGEPRVAISFGPAVFAYSKVLAFIAHCYRVAHIWQATLVVIAAAADFIDILEQTHLARVVPICRSEDALADILKGVS
ncbi:MAG: hypothetical protein GF418_11535 [Chitinivibrionales bacterium]|nr:hypothetical protein [Chitinivibrionales bacterium]MBD3396247.1 hypothetical protein [Chitinivibrionales bacterium]